MVYRDAVGLPRQLVAYLVFLRRVRCNDADVRRVNVVRTEELTNEVDDETRLGRIHRRGAHHGFGAADIVAEDGRVVGEGHDRAPAFKDVVVETPVRVASDVAVQYLAAVGIPLIVVAATTVVYVTLGYSIGGSDVLQQIPLYALVLIHGINMVSVLLVGGGQEELGWRGFALPRLLEQFTAVSASLLIGIVWAVWHLPLLVLEGTSQFGGDFVPYLITLVALSIMFTWLYRVTGGSVLLVMILHASQNASTGSAGALLPVENAAVLSWVLAGVMWMFALALIVIYGPDFRSSTPDIRETVEGRTPPAP